MTGGWCRWHCLNHTRNDDFHGGHSMQENRFLGARLTCKRVKCPRVLSIWNAILETNHAHVESHVVIWEHPSAMIGVYYLQVDERPNHPQKNKTMDVLNPLCMFGCGFHHCRKNKWRFVMCWTPSKKDHWLKWGNQGEKLSLMKLVHPETFLHRSKLWHVFAY